MRYADDDALALARTLWPDRLPRLTAAWLARASDDELLAMGALQRVYYQERIGGAGDRMIRVDTEWRRRRHAERGLPFP